MIGELAGMSWLEKIFLVCAVAGGFLFVVRFILQFFGMDGDADVPGELDATGDMHMDSDAAFSIFSFQGITAFLMMFGLMGLFVQTGVGLGAAVSIPAAAAVGVGASWMQARLLSALLGLQSSGTIDLKNAIGAEGTVYLTIPEGGTGKVQVYIQNRLQEFDAVSNDGSAIKTGEQVKVVFWKGDALTVEKI